MWEQSQEDSENGRTHIFQAAYKRKNAIFGPTTRFSGSEQSSSTVFGTSKSNLSPRHYTACLTNLGSHFSVGHQFRGGQGDGLRTNCVLRRQKPALRMESAVTSSSIASRAPRLSVLPSAVRSLSTAASVTSSLVCDETTGEMCAANCLFRSWEEKKRDVGGRYRVLRGNSRSVEKSVIGANALICITTRTQVSISFHLRVSQSIVSTSAGNRKRISLMASWVSHQCAGAG